MKIPFSPPFVDFCVEQEVLSCLRSGWITTGPKVKELELLMAKYAQCPYAVCVNSWTSGALLVLKWLGIGPGDEVIIPAYTYAATALVVLHVGATPVMVDVLDDFTIDPNLVLTKINQNTKAIIAVDIAGLPCNYSALNEIVKLDIVRSNFIPNNTVQAKFSRPILISDAAHSLGSFYENKPTSLAADVTIYSLHAVKNITTAEGGVIVFNLDELFDSFEIYSWMKLNSLNGQTKDAFTKSQGGSWRYDIVSPGLKINMPDICAAIGLAQLKKYDRILLPDRKRVFEHYNAFFENKYYAILPISRDEKRNSAYHLYPLRIKGITEEQRDFIIDKLAVLGISSNVHFIPLPLLSLFKDLGYLITDYPVAYKNYSIEISLPIYPQLTNNECVFIEENINQLILSLDRI
jgi:dTDP-4-amino-4,6-dideoxygalactose transaminase